MKKVLCVCLILIAVVLPVLSGCGKIEKEYDSSEAVTVLDERDNNKKDTAIPEIKSADRVMSTFFDISLYDEENYADIYLPDDFKYKVTYSGTGISMPSSYKDMVKDNWTLVETPDIKSDSKIMAGETATAVFSDSYGKKITAVFFNESTRSQALISCPIVKFSVEENFKYKTGSQYGQFWVNGVTNDSAITDVVDCLGAPSHFYSVSDNEYYLDYFLNANDRRSKITVYIDVANDGVTKIEFSKY
ncbi:MAG: hypothetical protein IKZ59_04835 [Clostridia bacterium]|nr:hypothetical protein [Clostridia bacterium]